MSSENGAKKDDANLPLFETVREGSSAYKVFAGSVFLGIILVLFFRLTNIPEESGRRWAWILMFLSEALFAFYWIITQSVRWNVVQRLPFKNRLSIRYEDKLPEVDVFVCTADPVIEPPTLVVNTVLSVMSYNYPTEKLSIYLSDDGCSEFTLFALLEARDFAQRWIPFCKKFDIEPRAPSAYFQRDLDLDKLQDGDDSSFAREWSDVKKLYEEMNIRVETIVKKGGIPAEIKEKVKGFSEWNSKIAKNDHQSIVQIVNDGKNSKYLDVDGNKLPRLVYLSREKRPGRPHNFKAGSMNALIRVSSRISNAPIILNVDCDMYSNDPDSIRDALCFFMDEKQGHEVSYVQYPQRYHNIDKNDIYSSVTHVTHKKELAGLDGYRGALYCGTGCFHRRASLSGKKFPDGEFADAIISPINEAQKEEFEASSKVVADCSYEDGTEWGKQMGLVYGCPVEDIVTGLSIQCRGWKPIYYNPPKHAFLGIAATTLDQALIQHKRWSEGLFQIFISKYCPFILGHGKISLGAQMGYCVYLLWAPMSLSTLCYAVLPPLGLIHGIQLFPQVSSLWFFPFAYVFVAKNVYGLYEALSCGETLSTWWSSQRMLLYRRTTSYFFAFSDTIKRQLGLSEMTFSLTEKVADESVMRRYRDGILEFGSSSVMFIILATLGLVNLFGFVWGMKRIITGKSEDFVPQMILCGLVVMLNLPVYFALFFRSDKGCLPSSVLWMSLVLASLALLLPV